MSPKGTFLVLGDATVAFADIRSPGTLGNLAEHAFCEVNFIDVLKRKGLRVRGTTEIVPRGADRFAELLPAWEAVWPDLAHRMRAFVLISVEALSHYRTPPYDDGATEEEMVAMYKAKFAGAQV